MISYTFLPETEKMFKKLRVKTAFMKSVALDNKRFGRKETLRYSLQKLEVRFPNNPSKMVINSFFWFEANKFLREGRDWSIIYMQILTIKQ